MAEPGQFGMQQIPLKNPERKQSFYVNLLNNSQEAPSLAMQSHHGSQGYWKRTHFLEKKFI